MRASEFVTEIDTTTGGPIGARQHRELEADGSGGGSIDWQSKFKSKYGVDLPSDAVIASGISGKKLPDLEKDPELKKIIKRPDEKKTAK
jgi:hypothetical protein